MTADQILALVRKRVHPALHHLVKDDALLADLRLNPVDHWSICCDIEEDLGAELDWAKVEAWQTVTDIAASVLSVASANARCAVMPGGSSIHQKDRTPC